MILADVGQTIVIAAFPLTFPLTFPLGAFTAWRVYAVAVVIRSRCGSYRMVAAPEMVKSVEAIADCYAKLAALDMEVERAAAITL